MVSPESLAVLTQCPLVFPIPSIGPLRLFGALPHCVHLVHSSLEGHRTQNFERLLKVSIRFGEAKELDMFNADLAWGRLCLEDLDGLFDVIL
jgi:hypothetical protein